MTINRRRAPSSEISSEKKKSGHNQEAIYSKLINGKTIHGTQKGDVIDNNGKLHSVKTGKKWQIFLYRYDRIKNSKYLNILKPSLDAFTTNSSQYFKDRIKCIGFKEEYIKNNGRLAAKNITNIFIKNNIGENLYIKAKENLENANLILAKKLEDKNFLQNFLAEALFNINEVEFFAVKGAESKNLSTFHVFAKDDVLQIFTKYLTPTISTAGKTPEDYNVPGQKTLLRYQKTNNQLKNIVEIEIRNDSETHFREVRFNMYSKDALILLLDKRNNLSRHHINDALILHGAASKLYLG